jgi:hypothetical protein
VFSARRGTQREKIVKVEPIRRTVLNDAYELEAISENRLAKEGIKETKGA